MQSQLQERHPLTMPPLGQQPKEMQVKHTKTQTVHQAILIPTPHPQRQVKAAEIITTTKPLAVVVAASAALAAAANQRTTKAITTPLPQLQASHHQAVQSLKSQRRR